MFSLIKTLFYLLILNAVVNSIYGFNPFIGGFIYFVLIAFWFSSFRFRTRSSRNTTQSYESPKPRNTGDVIDVEYTEHKEN